jgi:hypothetical protein
MRGREWRARQRVLIADGVRDARRRALIAGGFRNARRRALKPSFFFDYSRIHLDWFCGNLGHPLETAACRGDAAPGGAFARVGFRDDKRLVSWPWRSAAGLFRVAEKRVLDPCMTRWNLHQTTDETLITELDTLVGDERKRTADVLAHLAEVDARTLYAERGYSSMFRYVVEHLGYCDGGARHRITAARLARRFPIIFERVAAGAIHLTGLNIIGAHLTAANHVELLDAVQGKSKRQIEEIVAARSPRSDVLSMIVPVHAAAPAPMDSASPPPTSSPGSPSAALAGTTPLSAESFAVTFTIDRRTRDTLAEAQALLRHTVPDGDTGAIFARALDGMVAKLRKRKFAETDKPRASAKTDPDSRHIPADVKRDVAERDGRACTFVSDDGRRCAAGDWLEYHHEDPHGRGGPSTVENIRLLCATHNALLAERDYGREHIEAHKRACRVRPPAVPADLIDLAQQGLRELGFKQPLANRAVRHAAADLDANASLETLLRTSLRYTPAPRSR